MKNNRKLIHITREQYLFLDNNGVPFLRKEDSKINYGNGGYGLNTLNECYTASFLNKKPAKKSIKKCLNDIANELLDLANKIRLLQAGKEKEALSLNAKIMREKNG